MWCFVSQPNSVVLEVEVDQKADGQECLDKVCQQLGIIEVDYFGLQYLGSKGERLWLNLRNRIDEQLGGPPPYRLQLRVKFFVQPHLLLQDTTRHQAYLHVQHEIQTGRLQPTNYEMAVQLAALVAQADYGDCARMTATNQAALYKSLLTEDYTQCDNFVVAVTEAQSSLHGVLRPIAEYRALAIAGELANYGVEDHVARSMDDPGVTINLGVGPEGILLKREGTEQSHRIEYPMIKMATHAGKCLFLTVFSSDLSQDDSVLGFRLVSNRAANALYRCVTEMHSFYRCDTVRNVVLDQYSRDLKGMLAAIFNENTSLGKKYVFDIRRTSREAYDHARRQLYMESQRDSSDTHTGLDNCPQPSHSFERGDHSHLESQQECKVLKERLESLQDALTCRVCMDANIDTVFCPCGHVICCNSCAHSLDTCPMCRAAIGQVQAVYLPLLPHLSKEKKSGQETNCDSDNSLQTCSQGEVTDTDQRTLEAE